MAEETTQLVPETEATLQKQVLNSESQAIISQIISENDVNKTKDLTQLFNINQNKKTMIRVNKLNDLLDTITEQTMKRFTMKPDEISNKELLDALRVVEDIVERSTKQVSGISETPLIQINQQTNEVNIGNDKETLNRESRERVKNAVMSILSGLSTPAPDIIIETTEKKEDSQ